NATEDSNNERRRAESNASRAYMEDEFNVSKKSKQASLPNNLKTETNNSTIIVIDDDDDYILPLQIIPSIIEDDEDDHLLLNNDPDAAFATSVLENDQ
ncbi:12691_t:CDS:2, partial [Acaulospora colombiana]